MRIDPINSKIASEIKKVENAKKVDRAEKSKAAVKTDTSSFSSKAQRLSNTKADIDIVATRIANEPDIRKDKVEEVRRKIEQGYYNSPEFVDKLAEKLLSVFGITK